MLWTLSADRVGPDQTLQMPRLIWAFAVLMWHMDISHVVGHFFLKEDMHVFCVCVFDGMAKWSGNIYLFI